MARRLSFAVAMLAATVFLASCGGGSDEAGGTNSPLPASPTGNAATATNGSNGTNNGNSGTNGSNGNSGNNGKDGFDYVPWGPDDPPIPGNYAAFAVTSNQDLRCETVDSEAPRGDFWDVAAAVCRALRGDHAAWPERSTVPAPPDSGNAVQNCLDAELTAMLKRALRWHADNPGRQPRISYPSASAMSPCRYRIYGIEVLTGGSSGREGTIAVKINVAGGEKFAVTVDGQRVDDGDVDQNGDPESGLIELVVFLEPQPQPRNVRLTVSNGRGTDSASVDVPGAGEGGSPADTDSPGPPDLPPATDSPAPPDQPNGETSTSSAPAE
jgi:hypothetical protein